MIYKVIKRESAMPKIVNKNKRPTALSKAVAKYLASKGKKVAAEPAAPTSPVKVVNGGK